MKIKNVFKMEMVIWKMEMEIKAYDTKQNLTLDNSTWTKFNSFRVHKRDDISMIRLDVLNTPSIKAVGDLNQTEVI